jgi:hypothetical protein
MKATIKQKIRLEKIERLILPNAFRRFCPVCQFEKTFVSPDQATLLTRLTMREIFRLIETDAFHFFETDEGFPFICENSLKRENSLLNQWLVEENKMQVIQLLK